MRRPHYRTVTPLCGGAGKPPSPGGRRGVFAENDGRCSYCMIYVQVVGGVILPHVPMSVQIRVGPISAALRDEVRRACPLSISGVRFDEICQGWSDLYARMGVDDECEQVEDFRSTMARRLEIGLVSFEADNVDEALRSGVSS